MLFSNFIQIPRMIVFPSRARLMKYMMNCKYIYYGTYVYDHYEIENIHFSAQN